jgi:FAD/FMN-containing dehydrogenase
MNRIERLDPVAKTATVEAGVTLEALRAAAGAHGLSPGIDIAARGSATIGGMVSTNAGGSEAFRLGVMRQRVLGLEAVLADGDVLSDMTEVIKANEGLDVKQLLIGAEGTLGIVTRAVIRLSPVPACRATAAMTFATAAAAIAALNSLRAAPGFDLQTAEVMWGAYARAASAEQGNARFAAFALAPVCVIFEAGGEDMASVSAAFEAALGDLLDRGLALDCIVAASERERAEMWRVREDSWSIERLHPGGLWFDVSLPLNALDAYTERLVARLAAHDPALEAFVIGHLGDGNLHVTIAGPHPIPQRYDEIAPLVYEGIRSVGGSISAEHGVGLEKRAALAKFGDPGKLAAMRAIKQALDPLNLMNPGKVF